MKNIKEFKELILKYESITLENLETCKENLENKQILNGYDCELEEDEISELLREITNYGTKECTLCKSIEMDTVGSIIVCGSCAWVKLTNNICFGGINSETYENIECSTTIPKLKKAIGNRAKYMKSVLKENEL